MKPFIALGITNLLPVQEACFKLCKDKSLNERYFIHFETGQGKTALCLGIAAIRASYGEAVWIVN